MLHEYRLQEKLRLINKYICYVQGLYISVGLIINGLTEANTSLALRLPYRDCVISYPLYLEPRNEYFRTQTTHSKTVVISCCTESRWRMNLIPSKQPLQVIVWCPKLSYIFSGPCQLLTSALWRTQYMRISWSCSHNTQQVSRPCATSAHFKLSSTLSTRETVPLLEFTGLNRSLIFKNWFV